MSNKLTNDELTNNELTDDCESDHEPDDRNPNHESDLLPHCVTHHAPGGAELRGLRGREASVRPKC